MTVDEIKRQYSMREIVERYGFHITRAGFIFCPFHKGDNTASMKIYKDSYNCFGCGANGDIFTFIQRMDNCDFKTAFYALGGTYQKPTASSKLARYRLKKEKDKRERKEQEKKKARTMNNTMIHATRELMKQSNAMSDDWWFYMDLYHMAIIKDTNMEGGE